MPFVFQNYVVGVYQQRTETLGTVQHPCNIIVMDCDLDVCQIFISLNKEHNTKFGFLYPTKKYQQLKSKCLQCKLYATNGVLFRHWSIRGNKMCSIS